MKVFIDIQNQSKKFWLVVYYSKMIKKHRNKLKTGGGGEREKTEIALAGWSFRSFRKNRTSHIGWFLPVQE